MIKHVAFIMDGNRRWARERKLPLLVGHTKGYQAIEPLIDYAHKQGIKHLTFWAFSTENWNRDKKEVEVLLKIFRHIFQGSLIKRLKKNGVKINILGEIDAFPQDIAERVKKLVEETKENMNITVNIGLNYGGRAEILRAVNSLIHQNDSTITEEGFAKHLYTAGQPDPDFIIRTGGEQRLSGFLLWQSEYSELYFPEIYWPDFTPQEFAKALEEFENRKRRFGK